MVTPPLRRSEKLVILITALVIGIVGSLAIYAYINRDHRWYRVVSPTDEKAVQIIAINRLLRAYLMTESGDVYLCGGRSWRDTCQFVRPADLPVVEKPGRWNTCTGAFPETPPLPGTPIDTLEAGQCFEGRTYAKLVLLEDGTLWQWQRTYMWANGFALVTGIALSFGLGAVLGWLIVWLRRYLAEPAPQKATPAR